LSCVVGTRIEGRRVPLEWGTIVVAETIIRIEVILDEPLPPETVGILCDSMGALVCQPQEDMHIFYLEITENKLIIEFEVLIDTLILDPPSVEQPGIAYVYKIIPGLDFMPFLVIGGGLLLLWFMAM